MNQVQVITPPTAELIDAALVKSYLKIDHDDEDALIAVFITSAREQIERWCGLSIGSQERAWWYDTGKVKLEYNSIPTADEAIRNVNYYSQQAETEIPYGPIITVDAVSYLNSNDYSPSVEDQNYYLDGGDFKTFRADGNNRYKVEYTAGYTADNLPGGLKLIWLQLIAYLYTNRQDEAAQMPPFIQKALNPYKRSLI